MPCDEVRDQDGDADMDASIIMEVADVIEHIGPEVDDWFGQNNKGNKALRWNTKQQEAEAFHSAYHLANVANPLEATSTFE